jgi:hypothetical protein
MEHENLPDDTAHHTGSHRAVPSHVDRTKFDVRSLNTLSVVSLASALTGIGSLMAIITGHVALAQIKRSQENGRSLAIIGTILGYLGLIGATLLTIGAVLLALGYNYPAGWQPWFGGMNEWHRFMWRQGD